MKFHQLKYLIFIIFIISSCSVEKNTFTSRTFHNLTSHYNIYFNGYESFKRGIKRVENNYEDNYNLILPLFYYTDPAVAQSLSPDMQRSLEKATKVITLHSITAKPELKKGPQSEKQKEFYNQKEFNKWIDDNYLLMGKSYVYKNDFSLAIETFKKMLTDFPNEESVFEALIWMARAYEETGETREVLKILDNLKSNDDFPKKLRKDLFVTYAHHYIKEQDYENAILNLDKALKSTREKHYKIRYTYILAQLYQSLENGEKAISNYKKVVKMNPPYEMTFNAKINMARSFKAGSGRGKEFVSLLEKMLKDDKNIDYQDQIYYALGNIAQKDQDEAAALDYYKLSVSKSVDNLNQKGLSYISIADIYYDKPDYAMAQAYYDSSMQSIDDKFENYDELLNKSTSLNHLVEHLDVFEMEDSLQKLAAMDETERLVIIDKIIEEVKIKEEEERKRRQEEMDEMQYGMQMENLNRTSSNTSVGGKWYFYNVNAKSFGQPEFRMKWGNRKLEDNWRRKNKQSVEFGSAEEMSENMDTAQSSETRILSNTSREFYLKDIPLNDSALQESHARLEEALYNMGLVYITELHDDEEAVSAYKENLKRYPKGEFSILASYDLYEYYTRVGDISKAKQYKDYLIRNFPESPRAKILANPDYVNQLLSEQNRVKVLYEETYDSYYAGDYNKVIQNADYALDQYPEDDNIPRFKLLKAFSIGKLEGNDRLTDELALIIEEYPKHEIADYAKEVMNLVYNLSPEIEISDTEEEAEGIYSYREDTPYYFAIYSEITKDLNQINFNLINFNLDNFERQNFAIQKEMLANVEVIFVKTFEDYSVVKEYLNRFIQNSESVFKDVDQSAFNYFLISVDNYNKLKLDADLRKYYLYYRKYYQP